jgi:diguanylate cyclase (GGDEF)-like protein
MVLGRRSTDGQTSYSDVIDDLTALAFRGWSRIIAFGATGMTVATMQVARHYHDKTLWVLSIVMSLLAVARLAMIARFNRAAVSGLAYTGLRGTHLAYNGITVLYQCTLGWATIHIFSHHLVEAHLVSVIGIFMMCTGINGRAASSPLTAKACGLILLLALIVAIYDPHDPVALSEDGLIVLFAIAHCNMVQSKFDDAVEQIRAQRKLRLLSEQDPLTGLVNRRRFELELEALCLRETTFAILFIDLDRFKPVNDTYGHGVGDDLLKAVSGRLLATVRKEDIVARLGGDEFAVLIRPSTSHDGAKLLASRINKAIAEPFPLEGQSITIGTSIGVAVSARGGTKPSELLHRADEALYRSKEAGRGGFVMAS